METLNDKQFRFTRMLAGLITYAYSEGYTIQMGDVFAHDRHALNSYHYKHLAADLNLFKDGKYLTRREDHHLLGQYWKAYGGTWGGDFSSGDANHYSYGE